MFDSPLGPIQIRAVHHITAIEFHDKNERHNYAHSDLELQCEKELNEYFAGKREVFRFPFEQPGQNSNNVFGQNSCEFHLEQQFRIMVLLFDCDPNAFAQQELQMENNIAIVSTLPSCNRK